MSPRILLRQRISRRSRRAARTTQARKQVPPARKPAGGYKTNMAAVFFALRAAARAAHSPAPSAPRPAHRAAGGKKPVGRGREARAARLGALVRGSLRAGRALCTDRGKCSGPQRSNIKTVHHADPILQIRSERNLMRNTIFTLTSSDKACGDIRKSILSPFPYCTREILAEVRQRVEGEVTHGG